MKKAGLLVLTSIMLLLFFPKNIYAETENRIYDAVPKEVLSEFDNEILQSKTPDELLSYFSLNKIISFVHKKVKKYFPDFSALLIKILIYIAFLSIMQYFSFDKNKSGYLFIITCLANSILLMELYNNYSNSLLLCSKSLESIRIFAKASIPAITALLLATGKSFQSVLFSYGIGLFSNVVSELSDKIFMPLMHIFLAIGSCGCIWEDIHFTEITDLISKFIKWTLGIAFSLFTFTISIQNILTKASDNIAQKAVKAAAGSIPIMGNVLSDGIDGVYALVSGTKTTAAVIGIITILAIFSGPAIILALQILVTQVSYTAASFFGQKDCLSILKIFKQAYLLLFGLLSVSVLMCIVCYLLICIGAN